MVLNLYFHALNLYRKSCRRLHAVYAASNGNHCAHLSFKPMADPKGQFKCQESEKVPEENRGYVFEDRLERSAELKDEAKKLMEAGDYAEARQTYKRAYRKMLAKKRRREPRWISTQ